MNSQLNEKEHQIFINDDLNFTMHTNNRAWGDGKHETTLFMIKFIQKYGVKNKTVIDIGTGAGILSILCNKLEAKHILAIDNDYYAIEMAQKNFENNDVKNVTIKINDLTRFIDEKADIILANLGFPNQIDNLRIIKKNLNKDSFLIISWLKEMPFYLHNKDFEIVDHEEGVEYDAYVLKLKEEESDYDGERNKEN